MTQQREMAGGEAEITGDRSRVVIDCFPESVKNYEWCSTIVAVDVIRATTTAITAAAMGRECFLASDLDDAVAAADEIQDPLMVGEVGGYMPYGFELTNSPAAISERLDVERPAVLVSSSGTQLAREAEKQGSALLACLRNLTATTEKVLTEAPTDVLLIGAGSRGEFREEDQFCCALIANRLLDAGFEAYDERTAQIAERWRGAADGEWLESNSVGYLRETDQMSDLDFILQHRDDIPRAFLSSDGWVRPAVGEGHVSPARAAR